MAYLARRHTAATNGELTEILGLSRAESVPNLTRRFDAWLSTMRGFASSWSDWNMSI